jgi:hypothetical protein
MTGCRIGKVKLKGGAELHRLPILDRSEAQAGLSSASTVIINDFKAHEMAGYVVLGWAFDGHYSSGYFIHKDSPVGVGMLPSFVADALRRRMIGEGDWES